MCGIIGCVGERGTSSIPPVVEGLERLEYRGYDSCGVGYLLPVSCAISICKGTGTIKQLDKDHSLVNRLTTLPASVCIGHTRWATNGIVTDDNAHPHTDCHDRVAIVHNGIIDNCRSLREDLEKEGHKFSSDTDSEVIAHLIEVEMDKGCNLEMAVFRTTKKIRGTWAFLAIVAGEQKMVASKHCNSLVLGITGDWDNKNNRKIFVASDVTAFPDDVGEIAYMADGEMAVIDNENGVPDLKVYNEAMIRNANVESLFMPILSRQRHPGECPQSYTLKEIFESPQAVGGSIHDLDIRSGLMDTFLNSQEIVLLGCGSSYNAAKLGEYLFKFAESKSGGMGSKRIRSEIASEDDINRRHTLSNRDTTIIALSQSGETADVIDAVDYYVGKSNVIGVTNNVNSHLAQMSDFVVPLNCGPEIGVAATKSFMAQASIMYALMFGLMGRLGIGLEVLSRMQEKIEAALLYNYQKIKDVALAIDDEPSLYVISRGRGIPIGNEIALKMKELAYIHAENFVAGEMKHGPLALIERDTPVVALCMEGDKGIFNTISEIKARGGYVIGVGNENDDRFDEFIQLPGISGLVFPLVSVLPLYFLAYELAVVRGYDVDRPRSLAKSVTVR